MAKETLLRNQMRLLKSVKPFTLMMAGRGVGKSQGASRLVLKKIAEGRSVIVSGPTFRQLKIVLFKEIERALQLHGVPFHIDRSDMIFTINVNGRELYVYGCSADSFEAARGYTNVSDLVMDEAALHTREGLDVLMACLRGQAANPQVYMLTTPRGSSNWTAEYVNHPDCELITCGTRDNHFLSPAYVDLLEKQYSGDFFRQEILGQLVDTITQALVSPADIKAMRELQSSDQSIWNKVAGLDVGLSLGGDPSVLVSRQGRNLLECHSWHIDDAYRLASTVVAECTRQGIHTLFVDSTAIGKGPADIIRRMFPNTILVNFGGSPADTRFANRRAEIWMTLAQRVKDKTLVMPRGDGWEDVVEELLHTEYQMARSTNKLMLEPKSIVKSKLGRSPDAGDALALTFSMPDVMRESEIWIPQTTSLNGPHGWMG